MIDRRVIPWEEIRDRFRVRSESRGPAEVIQLTKTIEQLANDVLDCRHFTHDKGFKIDEVNLEVMEELYGRYGDVSLKFEL